MALLECLTFTLESNSGVSFKIESNLRVLNNGMIENHYRIWIASRAMKIQM
jgi:hypothetical protein